MRHLLPFTLLFSCIYSCKPKPIVNAKSFKLLIPDTTNNTRAQRDLRNVKRCSQIAKQLGLNDLQKGVNTFEVRAWYDFSFSNSKELYILRLLDSSYCINYFRFYPRSFDYDNKNVNQTRDPYTDPIIDSSISKTVLLRRADLKDFNPLIVWRLLSQSELRIPENFGFTDCYSVTIEAADMNHYKFVSHHCPDGYFERFKLKEITDFINYFQRVTALARTHNAILRYN